MPHKDPAKRKAYHAAYRKKYMPLWIERNREHIRAYDRKRYAEGKKMPITRNTYLLKRYGITEQQYNDMLLSQNNRCATCEEEFTRAPHVDHCHSTNKVRGLLCSPCNHALGLVYESTETLWRMRLYIIGHTIRANKNAQPQVLAPEN